MTIGIVGLGLIGGSLAKSLKKNTHYTVIGFDRDASVTESARSCGAIDQIGTASDLSHIDLLFLALYPKGILSFLNDHARFIKKKSIVMDLCGVKQLVCDALFPLSQLHDFIFIGGHPMAGREFSGFTAATDDLFNGASMILTPSHDTPTEVLKALHELFSLIGFTTIVNTTPENHDRMIAFTSQLAHVVSSAYIKSPEATQHSGYSAGSYKDLTRVAKLNEDLWTELFIANKEALVSEIDTIIKHLAEYRDAISHSNETLLNQLLKDGRLRKENIDNNEI